MTRAFDRHTEPSASDGEVMSMGVDLNPGLEEALANGGVRDRVLRAVRRAVPATDAEDVAQGVFCEALDAPRVPPDPQEIPSWLVGIARHRVADYFRRRVRATPDALPEGSAEAANFEAREALGRVLDAVGDDVQAKKTLQWMLLEHEGVQLKAVARAECLSHAAVRARVHRLRARLRRELAYLVGGVVLLAGVGAAWRARDVPEPAARESTASTMAPFWDGDFEIVRIRVGDDVDASARARIEAELAGALVSLHGTRLEVRTRTRDVARTVTVHTGGGGTSAIVATDDGSAAQSAGVRLEGSDLVVEPSAGPVRVLVLKRPGRP